MPLLTPSAVRKQIAAGQPDPIYLLQGEDDIEKAALAADFAELVEEGLRAFNVERIHAGDLTTGDKIVEGVSLLLSAARTLPMMAPRRIVIVVQAEMLLAPRRESEAASRALDSVEAFLKQPELQTTVVFVGAALDRRSRTYRLMQKHATVVECGAIADLADAERWLKTRAAAGGMDIEAGAARLIAERAGIDVRRLRAELDRLLLYAWGEKRITVADVREVVGPASLHDDWAMTNAIEAGQAGEALRQLALALDAGAAPEKILGQLGWVVRAKFPPLGADVRGAADAVFRTDVDLKRSAGDARVLLERLVVELCAARRHAKASRHARPAPIP
jgi:DNA polymerase-3 subunit delta